MKTLIVYASTYGFTKDCVEDLKKKINGDIYTANIESDEVPSLGEFDNIILGGSIYMGQLHKRLKAYCAQNAGLLGNKRLALFLCCGLTENFPESLKNAFPEELLKKAVARECFGGELRMDRMKLAHKIITGMMKKATAKEGKSDPVKKPENILKLAEAMNNR